MYNDMSVTMAQPSNLEHVTLIKYDSLQSPVLPQKQKSGGGGVLAMLKLGGWGGGGGTKTVGVV